MSNVLFDSLTNGLQNVLDLRQAQHGLTASNLANAETPGYRAKVIDFENALQSAMDGGDAMAMATTDVRHMGAGQALDQAHVIELEPSPWSVDGNSVMAEREQARLQENSLMYRAVAQGLTRRLAMLKFAANDGK